jgi:Tetracyclin repressor-like, C-terminal domain
VVTERWLARISQPLEAIAAQRGPGPAQFLRWLDQLIAAKRGKALEDPEPFATYVELTGEAREVVRAHVETLVGQVTRIIAEGVECGELEAAARRLLSGRSFTPPLGSTIRSPAEWSDPNIDDAFEEVWILVARGLGLRPR